MRGKELSIDMRKLILSLHKDGLGYIKIASKTKISINTVAKVIQRWKKSGTVATKPKPGAPRKTTDRIDQRILNNIKRDRGASATKIAADVAQQFSVSVTPQTIRNRLRENGFKAKAARKKPFISKKNMQKRLKWAKEHSTWTLNDWKQVIWSDESKFNLFGSDGIVKVWRKEGEALLPQCLRKTVKHGGGSVMLWGSMAWGGVGTMQFIDGIMTKEVYQTLLDQNVLPSARKLRLRRRFTFQQDNDPKHTAKIIQKYFQDSGIDVMPWVAQSPDLNPIEHLWAELERRIAKRCPKSKDDLKAMITSEWSKIEPEITKKLVESMPRRIQAVIQAKGGPTKY